VKQHMTQQRPAIAARVMTIDCTMPAPRLSPADWDSRSRRVWPGRYGGGDGEPGGELGVGGVSGGGATGAGGKISGIEGGCLGGIGGGGGGSPGLGFVGGVGGADGGSSGLGCSGGVGGGDAAALLTTVGCASVRKDHVGAVAHGAGATFALARAATVKAAKLEG